ncbi:S-adenosyl-L-methionine-dependent methyltransferase [Microdochium trichocladiopsis]|uniref:S-adenosyl-L-methionine-dependent methyltransferase n=1 Tax=Microdochium trichocladiopsis TaxID=1682393 RepID=A0A9P8XW67_9PEZI|nr:S-adenosyl-L-methionine-dependent methyltransferase [Microdochium trichocladiopsis]KAH7016206.1 S-adenosyl-L-methionine-dependent methyltransferase [Microdochium trichocladiopsis]
MGASKASANVPGDPAQVASPPKDELTTEGQHAASQPEPPTPPLAEVEEEYGNDSAYAESITNSTASLSASILECRTLHGRTYHSGRGEGQSCHHSSTLMQDGKLYLADLRDTVEKVLDVGCGTEQHPESEVIGLDISPQQPHWIPVNLKFEVDDITQPWTYDPNTFDYIHMRWLVGSITDWTLLYKEIFTALKPGGIFEHKESSCDIRSDNGTVGRDTALALWGTVFLEAGVKVKRTFAVVEDDIQVKAMEAAVFVDVQVTNMRVPIGGWPSDEKDKTIGKYAQLAVQRDVEGFVTFMWSSVMGWSKEEIAVYAAHLRGELNSGKFHAWCPMKVVIGRKP